MPQGHGTAASGGAGRPDGTDPAVWLAAFRAEHPDVSIHSTSRGVWFADGPAWRVYGRSLAEFLDKLRGRFPLSTPGPDG